MISDIEFQHPHNVGIELLLVKSQEQYAVLTLDKLRQVKTVVEVVLHRIGINVKPYVLLIDLTLVSHELLILEVIYDRNVPVDFPCSFYKLRLSEAGSI